MYFDYSGIECFLSLINGNTPLKTVLETTAYKKVFKHASKFGNTISVSDVNNSLKGKVTSFYGMKNIFDNVEKIRYFIDILKDNEKKWIKIVEEELSRIFPGDTLDGVVIYPIIGYDAGIGIEGSICMNINWWQNYADYPFEFLSCMIHETFHVLYERYHSIPTLSSLKRKEDKINFFYLMLQNEGFAVYSPLHLRNTNHFKANNMNPIFEDYEIIEDSIKLSELTELFFHIDSEIKTKEIELEEYLNLVFGEKRITYRIGCEIIRRIEGKFGIEEVRRAAITTPIVFFNNYHELLF